MSIASQIMSLKHCFILTCLAAIAQCDQPNIIFILADDLGFNDIGYHNSELITPNLDDLAHHGLILEQNYVQPLCSPSRSALLTGMYPYHIGRQDWVLDERWPTGLTLEKTLLPEALKSIGYRTHMVGKWHLGFCNEAYLPTSRGFESHYGYWGGAQDYYDKDNTYGYDFHDGLDIVETPDVKGVYSTFVYQRRALEIIEHHAATQLNNSAPLFLYLPLQSVHAPLAAPQEYLDMYPGTIFTRTRRTFSAMVTALDDVVGNVTAKLKEAGMYDNTVIIFSSDNGGLPMQGGSNEPLNGNKGSVQEGGTRVPAFVHAPMFPQNQGKVNHELFHISDWFPTLLHLAEAPADVVQDLTSDLDGIDQYDVLFGQATNLRTEVVHNIQHLGTTIMGAFRNTKWKLEQVPGLFGHIYKLFDLENDPNESHDLARQEPEVLALMTARYEELAASQVPGDNPDPVTGNSENGYFVTGWCDV